MGEEDSDEGEDSDEDENSDEDESNIGICFLCGRHTTENGGDCETKEWVCDICLPYCRKCGEIPRSRVDECCGDFWRSDFRKEWQDKLKKEREPIKAIEVKAIKDAKDTRERAIMDARNTEKQAIKDAKDAKKKAIKDAKDAKKRKAHRKKFMKQDSEAEEEDDSK